MGVFGTRSDVRLGVILGLWLGLSVVTGVHAQDGPTEVDLVARSLEATPKPVDQIVFATRLSYEDPHWYANISYFCDDENSKAYAGNGAPDVGKLVRLDLRTGETEVLVDAKGGSIRDPMVHYDAGRILFSWRKVGTDPYHLYEIGVDGTGLRQLTDGPYDDIEPTYLPDGDIVFVSTRCKRWVNCWLTQVATLFRCRPDGTGIHTISSNIEQDNTPSVLPDGRLLYTRWEYVDRSQVGYHHLWTINPDGAEQMTYYGNQQHYPLFIETQPIPHTERVIGVDSPGHGMRDHYGYISVFDPAFGPDDPRGVRRVSRGNAMYADPYPLSEDLFVVAQWNSLLLMDSEGNTQVIHQSEDFCFEPRPIMQRPREVVLNSRVEPERQTGRLVLTDVYAGRNMEGVERGDIKKLLVLESLPKPVNFSGGPDLTSWLGTFTLERVLGTVPVEEDGSASFEIPAVRPVFFVALDENDMSVKRMQSFVSVMPGETTSCVGCHEDRGSAPRLADAGALQALQREPSRIEPFEGYPDVLDFNRDIQPVLDKHCVSCHQLEEPAGGVALEGDLGPMYSLSFYQLFARLQVADGRNGFGNQPPRTIGSCASPLLDKMTPSAGWGTPGPHQGVTVTETEWRTVWLWIESAAPYAGTYAALRNNAEAGLFGQALAAIAPIGDILTGRCQACHGQGDLPAVPYAEPDYPDTRGITRPLAQHERRVIENDPLARMGLHAIWNMSRPELSPLLLAPLAEEAGGWGSCGEVFADREDVDFARLLQALSEAKKAADAIPRYATPEWQPNRQYVREMKRYGVLPPEFDLARDGLDPFALDQRYWTSLW